MPQLGGNPTGHWESLTLMRLNERLLAEIGARWNYVPDIDGAAVFSHALAGHAAEARSTFLRLHPTPTWAWKDPRLCVLLPFWRAVLACDPPVVLVLRHPLEISSSLAARDGLGQTHALRLWEQNLRYALLGCAGAPVFVVHYPALLADPLHVCDSLSSFIHALGIPAQANDEAIVKFLNPQLRHSIFHASDTAPLSASQRQLLNILMSLGGPYDRFQPPGEVK